MNVSGMYQNKGTVHPNHSKIKVHSVPLLLNCFLPVCFSSLPWGVSSCQVISRAVVCPYTFALCRRVSSCSSVFILLHFCSLLYCRSLLFCIASSSSVRSDVVQAVAVVAVTPVHRSIRSFDVKLISRSHNFHVSSFFAPCVCVSHFRVFFCFCFSLSVFDRLSPPSTVPINSACACFN